MHLVGYSSGHIWHVHTYIKKDSGGSTAKECFEEVIAQDRDKCVPLLDNMYKLILRTLFSQCMPSTGLNQFLFVMEQILGAAEPLTHASLHAMRHHFKLESDIDTIVDCMGALLSGITDPSATICSLHVSFLEFLTDKTCSGEFFINLPHIHKNLVLALFGVMKDNDGL